MSAQQVSSERLGIDPPDLPQIFASLAAVSKQLQRRGMSDEDTHRHLWTLANAVLASQGPPNPQPDQKVPSAGPLRVERVSSRPERAPVRPIGELIDGGAGGRWPAAPTMPAPAPAYELAPPAPQKPVRSAPDSLQPPLARGGSIVDIPLPLKRGDTQPGGADGGSPTRMRRVVMATGAVAVFSTVAGAAAGVGAEHTVVVGPEACRAPDHAPITVGVTQGSPHMRDRLRGIADEVLHSDNRQWAEVAEVLTREYGYHVSPERVAEANRTALSMNDGHPIQLAEYTADNVLQKDLRAVGDFCIAVPDPIVAGQYETQKDDTIKAIAERQEVKVADLRQWNPKLPANENEKLPPGKVVRVADKLDPRLVYQRADGHGIDFDPNDPDLIGLIAQIATANKHIKGPDEPLDIGMRYLPLQQTPAMRKEHIDPQEITHTPAPESYREPAPQPPKPAEKPGTGATEQRVLTLDERKKQIETLPLEADQKAQLVKFVEAIDALQETGAGKDVQLPVVLAQAIAASDWGRSPLAREHHNIFAIPAKDDWKGKVAWTTLEGSNARGKYRAYDSVQQAFEDYVHLMKTSPGYRPAQTNDEAALLAGLYGKDNAGIMAEIITSYFTGKLTDFQIAAIIGDARVESGLNPRSVEKVSDEVLRAKGRSGPARGLFQWQEGRLKALQDFAKSQGKAWDDPWLQLEFMWHEFQRSEAKAFAAFRATKTIEEATTVFCERYERPGIPHLDRRRSYAKQALAAYARNRQHQKDLQTSMNQYSLAGLAGMPVAMPKKPAAPRPVPEVSAATREKRPSQFTIFFKDKHGTRQQVVIKSAGGKFQLHPEKYSPIQNPLITNNNGNALVDIGGVMVPSKSLDPKKANGDSVWPVEGKDRVYGPRDMIIENRLNAVQVNPEGYQKFLEHDIVDLTRTVPKKYPYFSGKKNGYGTPNIPKDIKFDIWHITFTANNDRDGDAQASSMHNAGDHLGVQNYVNDQGQLYLLTRDNVAHTLPWDVKHHPEQFYHKTSVGTEFAAADMAGVTTAQYQTGIYRSFKFLTDNGFLTKDKPVGPIIDKMVQGHRERNPGNGAHADFPKLVMDIVREILKDFCVQMGYTR